MDLPFWLQIKTPKKTILTISSTESKNVDYFNGPSDEERPHTAVRSMASSSSRSAGDKELSPTRPRVTTSSSIASLEPKSLSEPALKNMTVVTETVSSIPQASLAPNGTGRLEPAGTLRVKASNETIRPKKDRKKASKKASSINSAPRRSPTIVGYETVFSPVSHRKLSSSQRYRRESVPLPHRPVPHSTGSDLREVVEHSLISSPTSRRISFRAITYRLSTTNLIREASTRSEVFENRVKKEMDDVASDDSDETFVYESNPPDPQPRRNKHHSRTPSGASLSSMQDRGITRSIATVLDNKRPLQKPRSMKFSSNTSNYGTADEEEYRDGTIRPRDRNGSQQVGWQSRVATGQSTILDDETSLFPLASKTKSLTAVGGRSSNAARLAVQHLRATSMKRADGYSSMDMEAEAADDERTPLITGTGTVRTPGRSRNGRPRGYRYGDLRPPPPRRNVIARTAGCLLILITVSILVFGVVAFFMAVSADLREVSVIEVKNVIASEQELMLDLVIKAINPNVVPITISDIDVNAFAKSSFVGSEKWWREHGREPTGNETDGLIPSHHKRTQERILRRRPQTALSKRDRDLFISDPPADKDPAAGKQTMLLGHILKFDNPLIFDGSFWRRQPKYSTGSLRLSKPGNHTEAGGTERWERVIKHDFELIIRGIMSYNRPLGTGTMSISISGTAAVKGTGDEDDGENPGDGKNTTRT
jgi:Vacuolar segregation subunit 7